MAERKSYRPAEPKKKSAPDTEALLLKGYGRMVKWLLFLCRYYFTSSEVFTYVNSVQ